MSERKKPTNQLNGNKDVTSEMEGVDAADPHPEQEGDPYNARKPVGQHPPDLAKDIGPNPAKHNGSAPSRPHNAENER